MCFDANTKLFSALLAVKTCSKALLTTCQGHGKSPCFLEVTFLQLVSPDYPMSFLPCVDGAESVECAFCYGS
jgi:hypothetical protein